jgi:hypothetical protein
MVYSKARNRLAISRAEKLIFIAGNKGAAATTEEQELQLLCRSEEPIEVA